MKNKTKIAKHKTVLFWHMRADLGTIDYSEVFIMEYVINFIWDAEASVWIATSNDIPGLVLESSSFDALMERTRFAVPELLSLNTFEPQPFSLTFLSECHERMVM